MKIGELIYKFRKEHSLSMGELSNMTGLSKAYISMLEKNINPSTNKPIVPSIHTIQSCAKAFGLTLDEIISQLDADQLINIAENPKNEDLLSIQAASRLQVIYDMLSEKGQRKFIEYLFDLKNNGENIDPEKYIEDIFTDNLNEEALKLKNKLLKKVKTKKHPRQS